MAPYRPLIQIYQQFTSAFKTKIDEAKRELQNKINQN